MGLPLAVELGRRMPTVGYDVSRDKVASLALGHDATGEVAPAQFEAARHLSFTDDPARLAQADFVIVAVPTPVDDAHKPDFTPLASAS